MDKIKDFRDKIKVEKIYSINYFDLDEIIQTKYQLDNFECALDQINGSTLRIQVDGKFDEFDEIDLQKFLETHRQKWNTVHLLLNDLCRNGYIDAGTYLIDIYW